MTGSSRELGVAGIGAADPSAASLFAYNDPDAADTAFGSGGTIQGRVRVEPPNINNNAWEAGGTLQTPTVITGTYGNLTLRADGGWNYRLDNDPITGLATNALAGRNPPDMETDIFEFRILDDDATENQLSDTFPIDISVTGANDHPVAPEDHPVAPDPVLTRTAFVGISFNHSPAFTDPDTGDTLSYSAVYVQNSAPITKPAWLTLDATTGIFTGMPASGDITTSDITVTVTATDDGSPQGMASASFALSVITATLPELTLSVDANTLTEGPGSVTVTIASTNGLPVPSSVQLRLTAPTGGVGFDANPWTGYDPAGAQAQDVAFTVTGADAVATSLELTTIASVANDVDNNDGTAMIELLASSSNYTLGDTASVSVTIADDDVPEASYSRQQRHHNLRAAPSTNDQRTVTVSLNDRSPSAPTEGLSEAGDG